MREDPKQRDVEALIAQARREGVQLALYECGWWCGECDPLHDDCCKPPDRLRAVLRGDA